MAATGLSLFEREEIRVGIDLGEANDEIAERIGVHRTSVGREIKRNGGRESYSAADAERRARLKRRRPKQPKCLINRELGDRVSLELQSGLSPAAIAAILKQEGGASVAAETIYRSVYSRKFCGVVGVAPSVLRTRRLRRKPRGRASPIGGHFLTKQPFRSVHDRPKYVLKRRQLGHWEGDLITGNANKSAVITLVERGSLFVQLVALPGSHEADRVRDALVKTFTSVPLECRRSLTWDRGAEMTRWLEIEEELDLPIYFCDPASPWQRPSNENTNRQMRFWLPKGSNLKAFNQVDLDAIAMLWNDQPRRQFNWRSAAEIYGF